MNVLSMHALIGAYREEGYEWVDELCSVLTENVKYACEYIEKHFEGVEVSAPEGTTCSSSTARSGAGSTGKNMGELEKAGWDIGVAWQDGRMFHGEYAIRMNLALPLSRVKEAFDRLSRYVFV